MNLVDNIARVQEQIVSACARSGRDPASVILVAVSKTHPPSMIEAAAQAGLQHFGENRVEEASIKIPAVQARLNQPLVWHMVGHIQSRKAKEVLPLFQIVHSVDSLKLAERLSRAALEQDRPLDILLECNVSGEASKYGFLAADDDSDGRLRTPFVEEVRQIADLPGLRLRGLMTMAPIVEKMEAARPVFAQLAALRGELEQTTSLALPELSMGMTDDFPVAIEEGATMIRIGRAIFGERP
jgi:hypothetical protein